MRALAKPAHPGATLAMAERRPKRFVGKQTMPVRVPEVASVLALLLILLIAKQFPLFDGLPIRNIMGIISLSFAIFLSLRLFQFELAKIRAE
jgi:hypothetical protein